MDPTPVPLERRRRPLLYGALVTGTLAAVAAAGWVLLSPSPLLHRQVAAGTTQPTESMSRPASDAPVQPAKLRPAHVELGHHIEGALQILRDFVGNDAEAHLHGVSFGGPTFCFSLPFRAGAGHGGERRRRIGDSLVV